MSDQAQFSNVLEHPARLRQAGPRVSLNGEPRPLNGALSSMLAQRIRVVLEGEVRWMSGYDALLHVLRERAVNGDAHASALLVQLVKYSGPAGTREPEIQPTIAAETPAERQLSTALMRRMLDRVGAMEAGTADRPAANGEPEGRSRRRLARRREQKHGV